MTEQPGFFGISDLQRENTRLKETIQQLRGELALATKPQQFLPVYHSPTYYTRHDTPYLRGPGVAMLVRPYTDLSGAWQFLADYKKEWVNYLNDDPLPDAEGAIKFAGQLCYLSFGEKRTKNKDAQRYFDKIKEDKHGSVVAHTYFSFLLYGVSRSLVFELERHAVGTEISQVSQRYVDKIRFVESEEQALDPDLHRKFEEKIDRVTVEYHESIRELSAKFNPDDYPSKTQYRKAVRERARDILPNNVEAPLFWTVNIRAFRHIIETRGSVHADTQIQALAKKLLLAIRQVAPKLFSDYTETEEGIVTPWRKI